MDEDEVGRGALGRAERMMVRMMASSSDFGIFFDGSILSLRSDRVFLVSCYQLW